MSQRREGALTFVVSLLVIDLSGLIPGEIVRILIFLTPLLAWGAGAQLEDERGWRPLLGLHAVHLACLAVAFA